MARSTPPITAEETTAALEKFEDAGIAARDLSERMFKTLNDDMGEIENALATTLTTISSLTELASKIAARVRNDADRRRLETKLRAETARDHVGPYETQF